MASPAELIDEELARATDPNRFDPSDAELQRIKKRNRDELGLPFFRVKGEVGKAKQKVRLPHGKVVVQSTAISNLVITIPKLMAKQLHVRKGSIVYLEYHDGMKCINIYKDDHDYEYYKKLLLLKKEIKRQQKSVVRSPDDELLV